jgi:hypothetical protein
MEELSASSSPFLTMASCWTPAQTQSSARKAFADLNFSFADIVVVRQKIALQPTCRDSADAFRNRLGVAQSPSAKQRFS